MDHFLTPILHRRRALRDFSSYLFPQIIGRKTATEEQVMDHFVQQGFSCLVCRQWRGWRTRRAAQERNEWQANGSFELLVIADIFLSDKDSFGPGARIYQRLFLT